MTTVQAQLLALLAPEMGRAEETRTLSVSTTPGSIDWSEYRGRVLLIQSDVAVALAWGSSLQVAPVASLTEDHGGVRVPPGLLVIHRVTDRAGRLGFVGDAAGSLWVAPVSQIVTP